MGFWNLRVDVGGGVGVCGAVPSVMDVAVFLQQFQQSMSFENQFIDRARTSRGLISVEIPQGAVLGGGVVPVLCNDSARVETVQKTVELPKLQVIDVVVVQFLDKVGVAVETVLKSVEIPQLQFIVGLDQFLNKVVYVPVAVHVEVVEVSVVQVIDKVWTSL